METNEAEEWRVIPSFPDYEASSLGRIRRKTPGKNTYPGRMLNPQTTKWGYLRCGIKSPQGKSCFRFVHVLVAEAFLGPVPPGLEVNHKDTVRTNARASNLEYCTHLENIRHAARINGANRREKCVSTKLTKEVVLELRKKHAAGSRIYELAKEAGVHSVTVLDVIARRTWAWLD